MFVDDNGRISISTRIDSRYVTDGRVDGHQPDTDAYR